MRFHCAKSPGSSGRLRRLTAPITTGSNVAGKVALHIHWCLGAAGGSRLEGQAGNLDGKSYTLVGPFS